MQASRLLVVVSALSAALALPAGAAWIDHPFANVPVCSETGWQAHPISVSDGSGGAIVVWPDSRIGSNDVYAQRISSTGETQWAANGVALSTAAGSQYPMVATSDGAGGAIVAWSDTRAGGSDVYAARVSANGASAWAQDGVPVCTQTGEQGEIAIASDGAGGAILVWQDMRSGSARLYAQRLSAAGVALWTAGGVPIPSTATAQYLPCICADGSGGAIISWQEPHPSSDIYAQRLSPSGVLLWPAAALCSATSDQVRPRIVGDGVGGAVVVWEDLRADGGDLYAQRLSDTGTPLWANNGVAVCATPGQQSWPAVCGDGAGGIVVAWQDTRLGGYDIYAQRIASAGSLTWPSSGVPICVDVGEQYSPVIAEAPEGGAVVLWKDGRGGNAYDVFAQGLDGAGTTKWSLGGVALTTQSHGANGQPGVVTDGAGGAIAAFECPRGATNYDIYAQRVFANGRIGEVSVVPVIAGAHDVPNDQGGYLKLSWNACWLDSEPYRAITDYRVWRSVPPNIARAALTSGTAARISGVENTAQPRSYRETSSASGTVYWEYVSTHVARRFAGYSTVVATTSDSVAGSNPFTLFMVEARSTDGVSFWDSPIDSGYSVDNLSPPAPSPFFARYDGSDVALHWLPSRVADFAEFRLYRGGSINFVPGPSNLIFAGRDTGLVDRAGLGGFYKLAAVDVHGNIGRFAMVSPASPTATLASFVSSDWTGSAASLVWYGAGLTGLWANVYRSDDGTSWRVIGQVAADEEGFVRFSDATVMPRHRYSYKLGILDEDTEHFAGITTIEIPGGRLAIRGVVGNPVRGEAIQFIASLAGTSPALARVLDLAGRVVREQNLQADLSGQLSLSLSGGERLRPGVYLLDVQQAGERAVTRFVYLR